MTSDPMRQAEDTRLIRNLNSLLEVSKALGAEVELDRILSVILSKATDVMEAERSSLFIFDDGWLEIPARKLCPEGRLSNLGKRIIRVGNFEQFALRHAFVAVCDVFRIKVH